MKRSRDTSSMGGSSPTPAIALTMVIRSTKYVCAVARESLRGILSGRQSSPVIKPVKCLDFYDKPYVREYVAVEATLITWRSDLPQSYGSKRRGSRNP